MSDGPRCQVRNVVGLRCQLHADHLGADGSQHEFPAHGSTIATLTDERDDARRDWERLKRGVAKFIAAWDSPIEDLAARLRAIDELRKAVP